MYAATPLWETPLHGGQPGHMRNFAVGAACANLNLDQAPLLVVVIVPVVA